MIEIGIKCGLDDFDEKKRCDSADFFEVIHGSQSDQRFARVSAEIRKMGKACFVHLPSKFSSKADRNQTLLNIASANSSVRFASREIIEKIIQETGVYSPAGWIIHAPTLQNFSTERGLFDRGSDEDLEVGLDWVKKLGKNILIENAPAAIDRGSLIYMIEPCPYELLTASNIPLVLDTAHLCTVKPDSVKFIETIRALLSNILYVHISTLKEKVLYDMHGNVFEATEPEYPSIDLINEILEMILKLSQSVSKTIYLVCEPNGNSEVHLRNYQILRDRIKMLK